MPPKQRAHKHGEKSKANRSAVVDYTKSPFAHVIEGYERALFLGPFLEAGRVPSVADVEIAVCFADLRGFTKYVHALQSNWQDTRVHEFLSEYFQIYPKAVLELVYALEPKAESEMSVQGEQVRNTIVPSMFKNLGDGMMLVWELQGGRAVHDAVTARILQILATIQRLFNHLVAAQAKGAEPPYSIAVSNLCLGFGLARGHAWRMNFGRQRTTDYAGSIVNLAARLYPHRIHAFADVQCCTQRWRQRFLTESGPITIELAGRWGSKRTSIELSAVSLKSAESVNGSFLSSQIT